MATATSSPWQHDATWHRHRQKWSPEMETRNGKVLTYNTIICYIYIYTYIPVTRIFVALQSLQSVPNLVPWALNLDRGKTDFEQTTTVQLSTLAECPMTNDTHKCDINIYIYILYLMYISLYIYILICRMLERFWTLKTPVLNSNLQTTMPFQGPALLQRDHKTQSLPPIRWWRSFSQTCLGGAKGFLSAMSFEKKEWSDLHDYCIYV